MAKRNQPKAQKYKRWCAHYWLKNMSCAEMRKFWSRLID